MNVSDIALDRSLRRSADARMRSALVRNARPGLPRGMPDRGCRWGMPDPGCRWECPAAAGAECPTGVAGGNARRRRGNARPGLPVRRECPTGVAGAAGMPDRGCRWECPARPGMPDRGCRWECPAAAGECPTGECPTGVAGAEECPAAESPTGMPDRGPECRPEYPTRGCRCTRWLEGPTTRRSSIWRIEATLGRGRVRVSWSADAQIEELVTLDRAPRQPAQDDASRSGGLASPVR
jgi:hypothetical protein